MSEKRNSAIVCCRTASMLMIVLCHIIGFYTFIPGHGFMGQILNVGVFSFLAISGYLYGSKTIDHFGVWFRKRYMTVMLPAILVIVPVLILEFCFGNKPGTFSAWIYLLNLQGLAFIIPGFYNYFSEVTVLGPLWFVTIIMLCYCIIPVLQRYRERFLSWQYSTIFVVCSIPVGFILALVTGFNPAYFLTFVIGYYLSAKGAFRSIRVRNLVLYSGVMLLAQVIRLLLQAMCDGSAIYQTYTQFSHMILGTWILYFFFALAQFFPTITDQLAGNRAITTGNDLSLYIYMTHCFFCKGVLNVYERTDSLLLATIVFLLATLLASFVLRKVTKNAQTALLARF